MWKEVPMSETRLPEAVRARLHRRAYRRLLWILPFAGLLFAIGIYGFSPGAQAFGRSVSFSPAPGLTPLLHFVTGVVAPALFILMGIVYVWVAASVVRDGGKEAIANAEAALEAGARLCSRCGHPVGSYRKTCRQCGEPVPATVRPSP
jgi:hypothetical protein